MVAKRLESGDDDSSGRSSGTCRHPGACCSQGVDANVSRAMADEPKDDERDPNDDPVIAGALERMQKRLKPGEDPVYYDNGREQERQAAAASEESGQARHVARPRLPRL